MRINLNFSRNTYLEVHDEYLPILIVCSHERSGTHFLMNSISENSLYLSEPYFNFDLNILGNQINFYLDEDVKSFFKNFSSIKIDNKNFYPISIIKSHHNTSIFKSCFNDKKINFLYIYRDPFQTLFSYWKIIHTWKWTEGPKTKSFKEFLSSKPMGQMTRYQVENYNNILQRWSAHVESWIDMAEKSNNIILVNYDDLNNDYNNTILKILKKLRLKVPEIIKRPSNDKFIKSLDRKLDDLDRKESIAFITSELKESPKLIQLFKIYK